MNITFIGMSGAGKSYVGEYAAAVFGMAYVDIDQHMEEMYKQPLQDILDNLGDAEFLKQQEQQVVSLQGKDNLVISPGGSVVYSVGAMDFLKQNSDIVYLEIDFAVIEKRVDERSRGIVGLDTNTLREVYDERVALYNKYADHTIQVTGRSRQTITQELRDILNIIS